MTHQTKHKPGGKDHDQSSHGRRGGEAKQTDSPEFKRWFGDSKIVDEKGEPKVLYHGTKPSFDKFDISKFGQFDDGWFGEGFYFADSPKQVEFYASDSDSPWKAGEGGSIMPVFLKMEKPYVWNSDPELTEVRNNGSASEFTDALQKQGYDGVIFEGPVSPSGLPDNQFVVFDPTQIKSATGNSGEFDPKNPSIKRSYNLASHARLLEIQGDLESFRDSVCAMTGDGSLQEVAFSIADEVFAMEEELASVCKSLYGSSKVPQKKHLAGTSHDHDQSTHAHGGGAGSSKKPKGSHGILARRNIDSVTPEQLDAIAAAHLKVQMAPKDSKERSDAIEEFGKADGGAIVNDEKVVGAVWERQAQMLSDDLADLYKPGVGESDAEFAEAADLVNGLGWDESTYNVFFGELFSSIKEKQFGGGEVIQNDESLDPYSMKDIATLQEAALDAGDEASFNELKAAYRERDENLDTDEKRAKIKEAVETNTNQDSANWVASRIDTVQTGNIRATRNYVKKATEAGATVTIGKSGEVEADTDSRIAVKKMIARDVGARLAKKIDSEKLRAAADLIAPGHREGSEAAHEAIVASVNNAWADSSTNGNWLSVALQKTVAKKFGMNPEIGAVSSKGDANSDFVLESHSEAFDAIVESIYENTQQQLVDSGVESVVLYRGMRLDGDEQSSRADAEYMAASDALDKRTSLSPNTPDGYWVSDETIEANPLSSYSADYKTSHKFAKDEGYRFNVMIATEVPREQIFAMAVSGPGCLVENEYLVMKHEGQSAKSVVVDNRKSKSSMPEDVGKFWDNVEFSGEIE